MSNDYSWTAELERLLDKLCVDGLADGERRDLNTLLREGEPQRQYYRRYMQLHAAIKWNAFRRHQESTVLLQSLAKDNRHSSASDNGLLIPECPPLASPVSPIRPSTEPAGLHGVGAFPSTVYKAFGYVSSGWPAAYLAATLMTFVGLLISAHTYISSPTQVTTDIRNTKQQSTSANNIAMPVVGRVTGMADCVWFAGNDQNNLKSESRNLKSPVSLADRLCIRSGFLEITYDSGAKVLLQGPVTYEVESANGGHLAVGKLTAKLERSTNKASGESASIPSFAVRTPSAVVTDLGTEFGVEVDKHGATHSYVFRGLVEVQTIGHRGKLGESVRLGENGAATVKRVSEGAVLTVGRDRVNPKNFVRVGELPQSASNSTAKPIERWMAYSLQLRKDPSLIAYYTFESAQNDLTVLPNVSLSGHQFDAQIVGTDWVLGRLPGKYALLFHGPHSGNKVVLPEQERFNFKGPFSLAVWFRVSEFRGDHEGLLTKGDQAWRLQQASERNQLIFDTNYGPKNEHGTAGRTAIADKTWHLAVAVYEPMGNIARKQLYIDGRLDGESESPLSLQPSTEPVWLGANSMFPERVFHGWIDEVAILERAMSAKEVQKMFEAGDPSESPNRR